MTQTQRHAPSTGSWISRHWLATFNTFLAVYVLLPILAPTLMLVGAERPARLIYRAYSPMCHQMAFRSFFIGGEQAVYPLAEAHTHYTPFERYAEQLAEFEGIVADDWVPYFAAARQFLGSADMGFKMALCERDIAIFGFLLLGGLVFGLLRKRVRIKPLPLLLFVIIGMGPIGLDGFSQLFGYYGTLIEPIGRIFPLRESPPLIRTATGAWFGLCLAWLALPHLEISMRYSQQRDLRLSQRQDQ
jgi:uncharacterized membrane protein